MIRVFITVVEIVVLKILCMGDGLDESGCGLLRTHRVVQKHKIIE